MSVIATRLIKAAASGYGHARPAERGLFGIATSFAATVAVSRGINYVRERRRAFPRWRSIGRRLYHLPGAASSPRVHHFVPGIGLGFATGATAIMTREDGHERCLSLPFGTGLALTADELGLLIEGSNPYWGTEKLAFAQCGAASLGSAALAARFIRRGLQTTPAFAPSGHRALGQPDQPGQPS